MNFNLIDLGQEGSREHAGTPGNPRGPSFLKKNDDFRVPDHSINQFSKNHDVKKLNFTVSSMKHLSVDYEIFSIHVEYLQMRCILTFW